MAEFRRRIPMPRHHRTVMRIPESHVVYVCPEGCGRRHALRSIENGIGGSASFFELSLEDVSLGAYEESLSVMVGELFSRLGRRPPVVWLTFHCIDDVLATDTEAIVRKLGAEHPGTRFAVARINPIMADKVVGPKDMQAGVYDFIEMPSARDGGITLLGRFADLPASCEFKPLMNAWGVPTVRSLDACETFEEYQQLAHSCLALSTTWMGMAQAMAFKRKFGIPYADWEQTYNLNRIEDNYERLRLAMFRAGDRSKLRMASKEATQIRRDAFLRARTAVYDALSAFGDTPIVLDTLATFIPIPLAYELLRYGFNVAAIVTLHVDDPHERLKRRLRMEFPDVAIYETSDDAMVAADGRYEEAVALGHDAKLLLGAGRWVDMFHDEGCFGFDGVTKLMEAMVRALRQGESLIEGEGELGAKMSGLSCAGAGEGFAREAMGHGGGSAGGGAGGKLGVGADAVDGGELGVGAGGGLRANAEGEGRAVCDG